MYPTAKALPTVAIHDLDRPGQTLTINETDFDPALHVRADEPLDDEVRRRLLTDRDARGRFRSRTG